MVFWMIQCFERIGWVKDSMTHAQTSVSFLMNRPFERIVWMNDSMTRLIKPLITCICAHYRQTNQICSKLFFLNQSKHILIFIQELCIYKTIAFYDSSLVIKKNCKFFFSGFFSSHPVAYSRPPGRVSAPPRGGAPHRLRTTAITDHLFFHSFGVLLSLLKDMKSKKICICICFMATVYQRKCVSIWKSI